MEAETLKKLQVEETKMLGELIRYFEQNRIRYYALAGTMLGAVRHEGFIPWDDDIDIGVPREDYERLIRMLRASKTLGSMRVRHYSFDKDYNYYPLRVMNPDVTLTYMKGGKEEQTDAFITLFPLDGMPGNALVRFVHARYLLWRRFAFVMARYQKLVDYRQPSYSAIKRILVKLAGDLRLYRFFDEQKTFDRMNKGLMRWRFDGTRYILCLMGGYRLKELFPYEVFGNGRKYRFDNLEIVGPVDYDAYLTQIYSDYMTPPPVDSPERNHHTIADIEFGKGCNTAN